MADTNTVELPFDPAAGGHTEGPLTLVKNPQTGRRFWVCPAHIHTVQGRNPAWEETKGDAPTEVHCGDRFRGS